MSKRKSSTKKDVNPQTGIPLEEEKTLEPEYIGLLQEIQDRGLLWQSCLSKAHGYEFLDPEKCKEKNLDPDIHTAKTAELTKRLVELGKSINDKHKLNGVRFQSLMLAKFNNVEYKDLLIPGHNVKPKQKAPEKSMYSKRKVRTAVDYIGKRIKLSPSDEKACMVVGVRINMEKELDLEVRMDDEDEVFCVAFKVYDIVV